MNGPLLAASALAVAVVLGAACFPQGATRENTAWLRHIKSPVVTPSAPRVAQLVAELHRPDLQRDAYTPAEQIAANAVHELRAGREWDAALLLSLASYRYHQQAMLAGQIGREQLSRIHPARYDDFTELIRGEVRLFNDQNFDQELELLRDHLFGAAVASERRDRYVEKLARGGSEDEQFAEKLSDFQTRVSNRSERVHHRALARAFRARLLADRRQSGRDGFAFYYLAATPLDDFRLAALDLTDRPFHAVLLRNMVPRMDTLRAAVRARLNSTRPETRSLAALAMGMAPDAGDVPSVEGRLAAETDPRALDSLRFALIRQDREEYLDALMERAVRARGKEREHALVLLQWLPEALKAKYSEDKFLALALDSSASQFSRAMALVIIGDIASQRALAHKSMRAVLGLARAGDKVIAASARIAVKQLQLSAAECKSFYREYQAARAPLVTRLAEVASLGDLDFLDRAYGDGLAANRRDAESDGSDIQNAAIQATASIPGAASRQLLMRWLVNAGPDSGVRWLLAMVLAARSDADRKEIANLANLDESTRLMLALALDSQDLPEAMKRALSKLPIGDIAQLTMMSAILERRTLTTEMWRLASYDNYRFYPADAMVRRLAMSALVRIALRQRIDASGATDPGAGGRDSRPGVLAPPGQSPSGHAPEESGS